MSKKLSQAKMKASYKYVIGARYCALHTLLKHQSPVAYAIRVEGWACDLYELDWDVAVVTGYDYDRAVNTPFDHKILESFEKRAQACTDEQEINNLIKELVSLIKSNA